MYLVFEQVLGFVLPSILLLFWSVFSQLFARLSVVFCCDEDGSDSEYDDADASSNVARRCSADPDRNPDGNNFTRFLATLCHGLFDQRVDGEDMMTGQEGSLLFAIIHNQRPRHWNN
jgi:hypothetical protein